MDQLVSVVLQKIHMKKASMGLRGGSAVKTTDCSFKGPSLIPSTQQWLTIMYTSRSREEIPSLDLHGLCRCWYTAGKEKKKRLWGTNQPPRTCKAVAGRRHTHEQPGLQKEGLALEQDKGCGERAVSVSVIAMLKMLRQEVFSCGARTCLDKALIGS